ncbi:hypothetical protein ACHAXT_004293 [Thalassiosira profunda]
MIAHIKCIFAIAAFGHATSALVQPPPRTRSVASYGDSYARGPRCNTCQNNNIDRRRLALSSRRRDREEDDSTRQSNKRKRKRSDESSDDNGIDDDSYISANDFIDFDAMDKLFDDLPEYGVIRSLEPTYEYDPVDPLSVDEIELWMERNNLQQQKQQQKSRWRTLFPWVSPLTSLLLPRKYAPTSDGTPQRVGRKPMRKHSYFNDAVSTPKSLRGFASRPNSARNLLVTINIVAFIYQITTAVFYLPGFNRVLATSVAGDAYSAAALSEGLAAAIPQWTPAECILRALGLVGGGAGVVIASGSSMRGEVGKVIGRGPIAAHSMGPFFLDYAHQPYPLSHFQKHRYLSSGFLHGSLLHLGMNLRALLSLPSWLENGLGKGLYLSAFLVSVVTGNIAHTFSSMSGRAAATLCIGASAGICGLYGLMLSSLMKMGNSDAAYYVLKQMVWLVLFGWLVPNVSNAGHVGGFIGGWLVGFLFGPGYERSYSLNRASGSIRDNADSEFRQMMGPGIYPSEEQAFFPLRYLWMGLGVAALARPDLRVIPVALLRGLLQPGALSGTRALLR